jgi:ATP-dependent Lon protease
MGSKEIIPLFPLQVVLFPGEVLPLHIFEPRYREMIARCLETGESFGILAALGDNLASVGCTARIKRVIRRYDDGRLDIEAKGEVRLRLITTFDDKSYLTGEVEYIREDPGDTDLGLQEQATALHMKLLESLGNDIQPTSYSQGDFVSFRIAPTAGLDLEKRLELLELDTESERLSFLIDHLRALIPKVKVAADRQKRISSNGHF